MWESNSGPSSLTVLSSCLAQLTLLSKAQDIQKGHHIALSWNNIPKLQYKYTWANSISVSD